MNILHVDDEDDIREIAKMSLEIDPDFRVVSAASGAMALELISEEKPDLLLLDVMMPEMDGVETLRRIRMTAGCAELPAIFMTARTQSRDVEELVHQGALTVIPKPFDPLRLAEQIRSFLDQE